MVEPFKIRLLENMLDPVGSCPLLVWELDKLDLHKHCILIFIDKLVVYS